MIEKLEKDMDAASELSFVGWLLEEEKQASNASDFLIKTMGTFQASQDPTSNYIVGYLIAIRKVIAKKDS